MLAAEAVELGAALIRRNADLVHRVLFEAQKP